MNQSSITADDVRFLSALAQADAASRAARATVDASPASSAATWSVETGPPAEAVASMHAAVTYVELATGRRRVVVLVHPADADASAGRVSVLSPVGRSLLGCAPGDDAEVRLPDGRLLRLQVTEVRREARDG